MDIVFQPSGSSAIGDFNEVYLYVCPIPWPASGFFRLTQLIPTGRVDGGRSSRYCTSPIVWIHNKLTSVWQFRSDLVNRSLTPISNHLSTKLYAAWNIYIQPTFFTEISNLEIFSSMQTVNSKYAILVWLEATPLEVEPQRLLGIKVLWRNTSLQGGTEPLRSC